MAASKPTSRNLLFLYEGDWPDSDRRLVIISEVPMFYTTFPGTNDQGFFALYHLSYNPHFQRAFSKTIAGYQALSRLSSIIF
jgi:hypothetical protein